MQLTGHDGIPIVPFGPHATCNLELCPIEYSIFQYRPSLAANTTFIILYFILLLVHLCLGLRLRSFWFMSCMIAGCVSNIIGYGARVLLWTNPFSFAGFLIQIIFISMAPVYYSAAIYVTMTKTVEELDESLSRIKPRLYYVIFVFCDLGALVLQAGGGAISTISSGDNKAGVDLALAGLIFQVVTMLAFCGLLADYLIRYLRALPSRSVHLRLKLFLGFLSFAILLILGRCAYRVAELSEGYSGTLFHSQPLFIGLEGGLIVLAVTALCIGHPGFVFEDPANRVSWSDRVSSPDGVEMDAELVSK